MEDTFHLGIKALIKNANGEILLLKINPEALKNFQGEPYWDIPGGRVQKGNSVEDTLSREVKEETGINAISDIKRLDMVLSNIRIPMGTDTVGLILAVYECSIPDNSTIQLSNEHIEYGWFDIKAAKQLLSIKYPQEFIEKI